MVQGLGRIIHLVSAKKKFRQENVNGIKILLDGQFVVQKDMYFKKCVPHGFAGLTILSDSSRERHRQNVSYGSSRRPDSPPLSRSTPGDGKKYKAVPRDLGGFGGKLSGWWGRITPLSKEII